MTETDLIDGVLRREGGWRDAKQRPDKSWDPPTNLGVTLPTLQRWYRRTSPGYIATEAELRHLTPELAGAIYRMMYIEEPGFTAANIPFEPLRVQLIDFGVNSGPERAVRWLQRVLGFPASQCDGVLGPMTSGVLRKLHTTVYYLDAKGNAYQTPTFLRYVNDALVAARSYMIDRATDTGAMRKQDEEGVESRALSFFLAVP